MRILAITHGFDERAAERGHVAAIGGGDGELAVDQRHISIGERGVEPGQAPVGEGLAGPVHGHVEACAQILDARGQAHAGQQR